MSKDDVIVVEGVVTDLLPGTMFKVKLVNGHIITAYLCGKMRQHTVKVGVGDNVKVEMSPYDLDKGRISYRIKN
jgi:translation initiation factor IF-1